MTAFLTMLVDYLHAEWSMTDDDIADALSINMRNGAVVCAVPLTFD